MQNDAVLGGNQPENPAKIKGSKTVLSLLQRNKRHCSVPILLSFNMPEG